MPLRTNFFVDFKRTSLSYVFMLFVFVLPFAAPGNIFCLDAGFKYFRNYNNNEYGLHPQNWSILQDKRGIIYVANQEGILEYDGVSWRKINIPNDTARSLAMSANGTIYVGGNDEIGYLSPDKTGTLYYKSLIGHLADNRKHFSYVWMTHATKEGIYFKTSRFLFRWEPGTSNMEIWEPEFDFYYDSFTCNGALYINEGKTGLRKMVGNELKEVPGGDIFANEGIAMIAPFDEKKLLIGTGSAGFYLFDGRTMAAFTTDADDYLKKNNLYHGAPLRVSPDHFALATLRGGLVIIDRKGKQKEIFDKEYGLQNDSVKYVLEDSHGNLWLALNSGITKIEYVSPLSIYDNRSGLSGLTQTVVKHRNILYVGTYKGLFFRPSTGENKFERFSNIPGKCWSLLSHGKILLAATDKGVYSIESKGNIFSKNVIKGRSYVLLKSVAKPGRIWVGTQEGLVSLYPDNRTGGLDTEYRFKKIAREIRTIVEDKKEKPDLWLGTTAGVVLRVEFPDNKTITAHTITPYSRSEGLPDGYVHVFKAVGQVIFATREGIYRFDEEQDVFVPDTMFGDEFAGGSRGVFRIAEDSNKRIWFYSMFENFQVLPKEDGSFELVPSPVRRTPSAQVNEIYPEPGGAIIWFAGHEGLIRYDAATLMKYDYDFSTLIRRVSVNERLYFDGCKRNDKHAAEPMSGSQLPAFSYQDRNFRFEFAAPSFEGEERTQYCCFLEGYNKNWSAWTKDIKIDYTNLDSGRYRFRVKSRNAYGYLGQADVFRFRILPPWYKTWWFFLISILSGFLSVFLIIKWRSDKLERDKQKLEQIVKERTKEINAKNKQLKEQTLQLQEQSDKLKEMDRVKSRFFANISHEFRTPLTLIMGPMELMQAKTRSKEQKEQFDLMLRNSQRLLSLINQLLELSKIDSGKMKLQATRSNIIPFLKGIFFSFESLANRKKLNLQFITEEKDITLYFDVEKLEQVTCNLLINAIKFTPAEGDITIKVKKLPDAADISISDTGIGIPRDQLVHIFDRFYRVEDSTNDPGKHMVQGTGIGLALVKELIELHHGEIDVRSTKGENSGTEFTIRLPLGEKHLKPGEIAAASEISQRKRKPFKIPTPYSIEGKDDRDSPEEGKETAGKDGEKELEPRQKHVILVVDDNADVRLYIRKSLEPHYIVTTAENGQEGVRAAKEIIPDLIISDVMMPGIDGFQLCTILKNEIITSHIPVILLTAKASEENIIQGLETGADDYITKPFNVKILLTRIKNLIELRRHLQMKIQRQKRLMPAEIAVSSIDETFLEEFQDILEKNISDPELNIDQLCKKLYMGRTTLFRKIEALTGQTPNQFIQSYRLERAAQLLKADFGNVTEVSFEVGFSSSAYFTKCFKEKFHQLPSTYQASESPGSQSSQ